METKINKNNFYYNSFAVFSVVEKLPENINYNKPDFITPSNSRYYYTEEGVYRIADHWGKMKNCFWLIDRNPSNHTNYNRVQIIAFCKWADFTDLKGTQVHVDGIQDYNNFPNLKEIVEKFYPVTYNCTYEMQYID